MFFFNCTLFYSFKTSMALDELGGNVDLTVSVTVAPGNLTVILFPLSEEQTED